MTVMAPPTATARQLEGEVIKGCQTIRAAWIYVAERLYRIDQDELWRDLGYDSFPAFLAQPSIDISYANARVLIRCYGEFIAQRGVSRKALDGIGIARLKVVLSPIRAGNVSVEDGLDDARELTHRELRAKYKGAGIWATEAADIETCPTCGARRRVRA